MPSPCTGAAGMAPPATDGSGAGGAGLQATGLKILYVEDDARSAAELVELAEAKGDTVIWEATGSGGLLRAGRDEFDVVILDRMLPDVDGLTILRRLRESGVGTPVLLLSALGRTAGEIVTREMLLRDVWQMNFDPQTNVVDVNVGRLRRKLEEGFDKPALETIWGSGYRLLDGR